MCTEIQSLPQPLNLLTHTQQSPAFEKAAPSSFVIAPQRHKRSELSKLASEHCSAHSCCSQTPRCSPCLHPPCTSSCRGGTEPGCFTSTHLLEHLAVLVGKDTKSASDPLHARAQQRHHVDICHTVEENLPVLISLETQIEALRYRTDCYSLKETRSPIPLRKGRAAKQST